MSRRRWRRLQSFEVYVAHSLPDCFFLSLYTFVVLYLFRTYAMVLGRGSMTIACHPGLLALNVVIYDAFVALTVAALQTNAFDLYRVIVQYFIGAVYVSMAAVMLRLLMMVHFSLANPKVFTTAVRLQHPGSPPAGAATGLLEGASCAGGGQPCVPCTRACVPPSST